MPLEDLSLIPTASSGLNISSAPTEPVSLAPPPALALPRAGRPGRSNGGEPSGALELSERPEVSNVSPVESGVIGLLRADSSGSSTILLLLPALPSEGSRARPSISGAGLGPSGTGSSAAPDIVETLWWVGLKPTTTKQSLFHRTWEGSLDYRSHAAHVSHPPIHTGDSQLPDAMRASSAGVGCDSLPPTTLASTAPHCLHTRFVEPHNQVTSTQHEAGFQLAAWFGTGLHLARIMPPCGGEYVWIQILVTKGTLISYQRAQTRLTRLEVRARGAAQGAP